MDADSADPDRGPREPSATDELTQRNADKRQKRNPRRRGNATLELSNAPSSPRASSPATTRAMVAQVSHSITG